MNPIAFRQTAGRLLRGALASPAVYPLLRRRAGVSAQTLSILMYHTLGEDSERLDAWTVVRQRDFLQQVRQLRVHHDIVSLDDALKSAPAGQGARPRAVLTFDDGNASLVSHLLPLLERERLPVTIYIATAHVESGGAYWFDALMTALQPPCETTFDLGRWGLGQFPVGHHDSAINWLRISALLEALKTLGPDEREAASAEVLRVAGKGRSEAAVRSLQPLAPAQVGELSRSPWVTIGSHTHGHELLDQVPLRAAVASIETSVERLQAWTGRPVRHFAYPNGNHSPVIVEAVRRLGFASAVTTRPARASAKGDPLLLPRIGIGRYDDLARFRLGLLAPMDGLGR